jgi:hypothetical protein
LRIPRRTHPRGTATVQPLVVARADCFQSPVAMGVKHPNKGATRSQQSRKGAAVWATASTSKEPSTALWEALPTPDSSKIITAGNRKLPSKHGNLLNYPVIPVITTVINN